jgi:hypothetical protein
MASVFNLQRRVAQEMEALKLFHGGVSIRVAVEWVLQTNSGGSREMMFDAHVGRGEIPNRLYTVETERDMVLDDLKKYGRTQGIYANRDVYVVRRKVQCIHLVRFFPSTIIL